jgi:CheY-like chemotaxis protein
VLHDVGNVLMTIRLRAERLVAQERENDEVAAIAEAARRAGTLARRMLDLQRGVAVESRPFAVEAEAARVVSALAAAAPLGVTLRLDVPPTLPRALGDPWQVEQVLLNLVKNAVEAVGERGTVTLSVRALAGRVEAAVQDDGPGMAPEVVARLGAPFVTTKAVGQGTGLGVFMARSLVEAMGGVLRWESAPGQGTRALVSLPAAEEGAPSGAGVLLALSDAAERERLSRPLKLDGIPVLTAGDGERAMKLLAAKGDAVGLVLLDVTLPGKGARAVLAELRQLHPDLTVYLVADSAEPERVEAAKSAGAAGMLAAPLEPEDVRDLLGAAGPAHPDDASPKPERLPIQ